MKKKEQKGKEKRQCQIADTGNKLFRPTAVFASAKRLLENE